MSRPTDFARFAVLACLSACGGSSSPKDAAIPKDASSSVRDADVLPSGDFAGFDLTGFADDMAQQQRDLGSPDLSTINRPFVSTNVTPDGTADVSLTVSPFGSGCMRAYTASCELITCLAADTDGYPSGAAFDTFGAITLRQGRTVKTVNPAVSAGTGSATFALDQAQQFTIDVAAGTIPAFSGTIQIPHAISSQSTQIATGTISRASDLTFSFATDSVTAPSAYLESDATALSVVRCTYAPGSAQGVVPASLMSQMPAGAAIAKVFSVNAANSTVGNFDVRVRGLNTVSADGGATSWNVTLD